MSSIVAWTNTSQGVLQHYPWVKWSSLRLTMDHNDISPPHLPARVGILLKTEIGAYIAPYVEDTTTLKRGPVARTDGVTWTQGRHIDRMHSHDPQSGGQRNGVQRY